MNRYEFIEAVLNFLKHKILLIVVKIVSLLVFLMISFYTYNRVYTSISLIELKNLLDIYFWFFSTITQFNGAIIGLVLATLGISWVIHSEKTIFLFTKKDYMILRISIFIFLVNTFFGFLWLSIFSNSYILIKLISLSIVIEIWGLLLLGLFFVRMVNNFENKALKELNLLETEKIINQLDYEYEGEGINKIYIINKNQPISIDGITIFASTSSCDLKYSFPEIDKIFQNKAQLSVIPKNLFDKLPIKNFLNWEIIFKLTTSRGNSYYMGVIIIFNKIDKKNLKITNSPRFQALVEDEYISLSKRDL